MSSVGNCGFVIIMYSIKNNLSVIWCFICVCMSFGYVLCAVLDSCDKTRHVFTDSRGVITDGPLESNYTQDSHCEWLIKANGTGKYITLKFHTMGTECSYDYVFVYDGDSFRSPLLGSFSGKTAPQQVIASSGYMLILLYSDTNYVLNGFRAEFFVMDCPNNCTSESHGVCFHHQCVCTDDWGGDDCSHRLCPDDCGRNRGHGRCYMGKCICEEGYSGAACSLHNADPVGNKWHWLSHTGGGLTPRAAHTAVYIEEVDSLYVYGGYDLNRVLGNLEIYNFPNSTWSNAAGDILEDKTLQKTIDPTSVGALLEHVGPMGEERWGLPKTNSFFRNFLFSFSDASNHTNRKLRYTRSIDEPTSRYGHAACSIPGGFLIYGGKVDNGSLSNELWSFDAYTRRWSLRAQSSPIFPPALTRHSLTAAGDMVYLFGGSTTDGEFSSKLFKIRLQDDGEEIWEYVQPRGGKELDVRVVAHSTVYHAASNSLVIYGGVVAGVARFSKLSDRMFAFHLENKHWTELHYPREYLREKFVPRERAFHTANIIGNYLIVFGGYSHRHNKEEICYDNQMYLYHMGCHAWVNPDILGEGQESLYPKQQGVFAHSASVRNMNTLLLVGGYHGNVNGDLLAYTVPPMVSARKGEHYDPETACSRHKKYLECSADPECGWCSVDEFCYGRMLGANCTTNLQTTRCPGVCPALGDCHSCLIHGNTSTSLVSAAQKLRLGECTWCVQNARCQHKEDNYGVCGIREDSPSQVPGWWGAKGTEVHRPEQCRELDKRPGLTFLKYHHPVNLTLPDHVGIINATTVDFDPPPFPTRKNFVNGEMVTRLQGFLRPTAQWQGQEKLQICVIDCNATLELKDLKGDVQLSASLLSVDKEQCDSQSWVVPQPPGRILVDFVAHKYINNNQVPTHSKMELQHYKETESAKVFTFEYLEPYANGSCSMYTNCLYCLTDSLCGWCDLTSQCVSRETDETESCNVDGDWRYLTLLPSACSNCSNYISCERCVDSGLCEWLVEEARCVRIRSGTGSLDVVTTNDKCPIPCYTRNDCTSCLDVRGRCVWCEATQQCFSFSVYTSEYQFGLCREWLDHTPTSQELSIMPTRRADQCKSCQSHSNCSTCLSSLSCGWCYNAVNPIEGKCVQGDFNRPQNTCENVLGMNYTRWAYAHCPDVDECGLGLHDCHKEAICTNTDGSFSCKCRQGFAGDGKTYCNRTCDHPCINGRCLGYPNYTCECNLGWTGENCSIDCGCNFHSNCTTGIGLCDSCQDWTTGEQCEKCLEGSYGNATSEQGCQKCDCNGHGNVTVGICDMDTGTCYCQDNTEGKRCDRCKQNYYGNPLNGGLCYYQCEARGMLTDAIGQGISSRQSYVSPWGGPPTRECLWIISPSERNAIIQLQMNATHLNVTCGENAVYVYDGMPELADTGQQSGLMAVFCREDAKPTMIVETKSGHLTVHFKQGNNNGEGFDAVYNILTCSNCPPPRYCKNEMCLCRDGWVGPYCSEPVCPENCGADMKRGECDHNYGRCICAAGWGGKSCRHKLNGSQIVFTELFNTHNLAPNYEHLRKTLPRFGHSLVADHRRGLWMFGGFSLSHGPLNDIRLFDILNGTWMQVTVDSTPDAKMPQGRYFHAADIVHSRQAIYVYGGLTKHIRLQLNENILKDFWQFDLHNQRWNEILPKDENWPPPLGGHTLTLYRNASYESLILIGGFSPEYGFLNTPWEYRLDTGLWVPLKITGKGPVGIYGHSTVFHSPTNSLYVFGGYIYKYNGTKATNIMFALRYETMQWVDLNSLGNIVFPNSVQPKARFLHSAITTDNYMLVFGGRMSSWNYTSSIFAYSYNCSQWINLTSEGVHRIGPLPAQTYSQAMTFANGTAYIVGGWGSETQYKVTRISLPEDMCELWSKSKHKCLQYQGCGSCTVEQNGYNVTHCLSNSRVISDQCVQRNNMHYSFSAGKTCPALSNLECTSRTDCSSCLLSSNCQWCQNCGGKCTSADSTCPKSDNCKEDKSALNYSMTCPEMECPASDCVQCAKWKGCDWKKEMYWHCVKGNESTTISKCDNECVYYKHCIDCLDRSHCRWSTQLNECIAINTQAMYCLGGVCGLILAGPDRDSCPEPCESYTQCSNCLRNAHCGWCALDDETGAGVCTEGSTEKPMTGTCRSIYKKFFNKINIADLTTNNFTWNYVRCPPENECNNDHHTCDRKSEVCKDLRDGFECECAEGYHQTEDGCMPVCTQGCVRGSCVSPNKCDCHFGYVGANCSIECQCNGHSECEGPDKLNVCRKCHNNTMGAQCESCKPLYVGNPKNRERCIPCLEYCNGHSQICLDENSTEPEPYLNLTLPELESYLKVGPTGKARCLRCANRTEGSKCERCLTGHFRGSTDLWLGCRPCNCHGHGDTCDPITGDKCNCRNNTESNTTQCQAKNSNQNCSDVQCVKCKEGYMGNPTDGHQCYKQMTVESKMCLDARHIDECKIKPKPLVPGETVFFVVQPRFMNVDIRITIDVTQGSLNLFVSNRDDTFKVTPNFTLGIHDIDLDSRYRIIPPSEEDSRYESGNTYSWMEHTAHGLRTYVTIPRNTTLLAVKGLKDRLVITLPQDKHRLDTTKFYIVLQALPSNDQPSTPSYGMVFFRQDQLHIDLFVFFSVFFSCFFLFLAACVVAWKAKQAADVRRARRRHVVEMLHMAQRPFAAVTLFLGQSTPISSRRAKPRRMPPLLEMRPVAVEPTDDGVAAVATVFVSLPGGHNTNVRLALASSLILLVRQYPSGGRAFLRRRSHHAVPQPT